MNAWLTLRVVTIFVEARFIRFAKLMFIVYKERPEFETRNTWMLASAR